MTITKTALLYVAIWYRL